jgi:hypothetical protein
LWDGLEHFVCARTAGDRGPGLSFGHESIEDVLRNAGFKDPDRHKIFFGNWTRDYNQLVVPILVKKPGQPPGLGMTKGAKPLDFPLRKLADDGFLTRQALTDIVNILAEIKFVDPESQEDSIDKQRQIYRVTPHRLGVYRPEEHQDNPAGLPDGRSKDPAFRGPVLPEDLAIDTATGMKRYIASPGCGSSLDLIERYLTEAIRLGRNSDGLRYFGMGLHVLEDFFCHTNMVEVSLYKLGHTGVVLWVKSEPKSLIPVTSGVFGFVDTVVSILYEIAHVLSQAADCATPGKRTAAQKLALILLRETRPDWAGRLDGWLTGIETVKKEYPKPFELACETREFLFGWVDKTLGYAIQQMVSLGDDIQSFADNTATGEPTHSQMSKDHDDHPLHVLAAKLAMEAVRRVGLAMAKAFERQATVQTVMAEVRLMMTHPQKTQWMDNIVREWAKDHPAEIKQAANRRRLGERSRQHYETLRKDVQRFYDNYDNSDTFFENLSKYFEGFSSN